MKLFWDEHYSVHVELIDEQHKKYFAIVNKIVDNLDSSAVDRQVIGEIVKELVDYAFYHFQVEEKYFTEFAYPEAESHIKGHDIYRNKMKGFLARMETVSDDEITALFGELSEFATEWFAEHILVEDQKYSQCFNEHGLK
jgi:hemerythrin